MGQVYRATDTRLGRNVAIKVLAPSFAGDSERIACFRREAVLLAALNHANIAHIYDIETIPGGGAAESESLYLIMELVEGETLEQRLTDGPLAIDDALSAAVQIAAALEAAHAKGIVHLDLKPANVMLEPKMPLLTKGPIHTPPKGPVVGATPQTRVRSAIFPNWQVLLFRFGKSGRARSPETSL
jgi:serine/threonine protein kinase